MGGWVEGDPDRIRERGDGIAGLFRSVRIGHLVVDIPGALPA